MPDVLTGKKRRFLPENLGSRAFKEEYNLKYAYVAGAMYKGIASKEIVVRMANARLLAFLGTGGMSLPEIESDLRYIQQQVGSNATYGMNLLCNLVHPELEEATVDLYLKYGIDCIEAAAYMQITPALARYRLKGLRGRADGTVAVPNRVLAKVSRPEVAQQFLSPPPAQIVQRLVQAGKISPEEARWSQQVPMAADICVEADSAGHTDKGVAYALMPVMRILRDELVRQFQYPFPVRVGAAGGLGTPEAVAAAFILGADFVLTGSVNQCTVEAGTSESVKDLLQQANVQDMAMAPAGDMFELGAKVQVLKKGLFFPARANKLYDLYRQYNSLDEIDEKTRHQIESKYFKKSFAEVYAETRQYYLKEAPEEIEKAERNPKFKMALVFRWYFFTSTRLALEGVEDQRVDYQIHCGPALGAFNQWVKGTRIENWRNRHVEEIAELLMRGAAEVLEERFAQFFAESAAGA